MQGASDLWRHDDDFPNGNHHLHKSRDINSKIFTLFVPPLFSKSVEWNNFQPLLYLLNSASTTEACSAENVHAVFGQWLHNMTRVIMVWLFISIPPNDATATLQPSMFISAATNPRWGCRGRRSSQSAVFGAYRDSGCKKIGYMGVAPDDVVLRMIVFWILHLMLLRNDRNWLQCSHSPWPPSVGETQPPAWMALSQRQPLFLCHMQ